MKGINREFSVARTPQQNGVAERKNRTLIEAARTILADLKLPTTFWAEAFNAACYVQNRVLVIKPHNKTPYELFLGRKPALSFMRPFGCPVTILNTINHLGKFNEKADEGFFMGYSTNSKAFRVFNSKTRIVEENLHVKFSDNTPNIIGSGPNWLFDIDALTKSMNYKPVVVENQSNGSTCTKACDNVDLLFSSSSKDSPGAGFKPLREEEKKDAEDPGNKDSEVPSTEEPRVNQEKDENVNNTNNINTVSPTDNAASIKDNVIEENIVYGCADDPNMPDLEEIGRFSDAENDDSGADMNNLDINFQVNHGHTQEEGIDYDEVFAPVTRIEAIRLFLAYASFKDFMVYQMDVKSAFLYEKIEEERGMIDKTLFIKRDKSDILLVQVYVDDIIFRSTRKEMCTEFKKMMHKKFQMGSMGELTFFLGLQVKQKEDGIFISQDKYVNEILTKFGFSNVKTASTPMETHKTLIKDEKREDLDENLYRSMIGSLMYLTSSRPDIMFVVCTCARFQVNLKISHLHAVKRFFRYLKGQPKLGLWYLKDLPFDLVAYTDSDYVGASLDRKSTTGGCQFLGCRLISWQCKKWIVVANSTTEAEYVAALNCYVKNSVFHSKTKHIEIRHHFIRDSNEKKLIQMINIHTDKNVADLLTKAFDPTGSEGFEQIIDFLNAHPIKYALTVNPTIYTSCVEQFWATAKVKNINEEAQLHAKKLTFYKAFFCPQWKFLIHTILQCLSTKTTAWNEFSSTIASVVIYLATDQKFNFSKYIFDSMVKNLDSATKFLMFPRFVQVFLNNQLEEMTNHTRIYVPPCHTKKISKNMKRVEKGFSGRDTPLFPTMLVQAQEELGEDIAIPIETHPTPTITQPSTSKPQKKQKPRKPRRQDTEKIQPSGPTTNVEDEAFNEKNISQHSNDPLHSGEDRIQLKELMELCIKLSDRVLNLETTKTAQAKEIANMKKRVKRLERKRKSRTHGLKRLYKVGLSARVVSYTDEESLGEEDSFKQGRISDINTNQDIYLVNVHRDEDIFGVNDQDEIMFDVNADLQALEELKSAKPKAVTTASTRPKAKSIVMQEPSETPTTIIIPLIKSQDNGKEIMVEPEMPLNKKAQIILDEEFAFKLQAREDEQERIIREKAQQIEEARLFMKFLENRRKFFAAKKAEEQRNKPPTKAQQRSLMCTYFKNIDGWKTRALKNKSFTEIKDLFDKVIRRINNFVNFRTELVEESTKKAQAEIAQESSSKRAGDELE
uniref:Integrase catalytic domain-containing protein n=1 Tax=Tanacetum cinerariifolium TaxID=118510 RepID=A0A6L2LHG2_TANCI|nr:hypothetical protein [Tanacetum cinerariifolium]